MKRRFILLLLLLIGCISLMSLVSILQFLDPYENKPLAIGLLSVSFLGSILGVGSVVLYFIKKIYYRGDVSMRHIFASMRQSIFLGIIGISYVTFIFFSIPLFVPFLGVVLFFFSFELFLQSLYYSY